MKKIIEIKNGNVRRLRIDYELGNLCNYKCWYCFPGSNDGDVPWPDVDVVKKNIVTLINYYLDNDIVDEVQLALLGGEVSLWKHLGEFVKYVSTHSKCKIYIITNGSRTLRWWKEYAVYFDSINISIHHESVDLDHIEELAKILHEQNICFFTDVLMDHTAWDKCMSIVDRLCNSKTRFMVLAKPIHVNGTTHYNEQQVQYLQTHLKKFPSLKTLLFHWNKFKKIPNIEITFEDGRKIKTKNEHFLIVNMMNRFKGWECNVGVNKLGINFHGEISGACRQKLFGLDYYYNINDLEFSNKFAPTIKPVVCEQKVCLCAGETALTKKKI